jgi:hypothetical protein
MPRPALLSLFYRVAGVDLIHSSVGIRSFYWKVRDRNKLGHYTEVIQMKDVIGLQAGRVSRAFCARLFVILAGVAVLAAIAAPAQATPTFGICTVNAASAQYSSGPLNSSAQYTSGPSFPDQGCVSGFNSSVAPGGSVSTRPFSLSPGLTTATVTVSQLAPFGGNPALSVSTASLDQGALHVNSDSQAAVGSCDGSCLSTGERATSEAEFYDTLHSLNAGTVTFVAGLEGSIGLVANANSASYTLQEIFQIGGASGCWGSQFGLGFAPCGSQNFGFGGTGFYFQAYNGFGFTGTFDVTAGETTTFKTFLLVDCSGGYGCDFSNTATFGISGVSYTEDSGVLFSQPSSSVPEPGTWCAMGVGLLVLGGLRRRAGVGDRIE